MPVFDVAHDAAHVAEGGRHEQEAGVGEGDERHLPGPAAVAVGVVVELVHHDVWGVEVLTLAEGEVCQHLGRAADDGSVRIDAGVTGQHAHVVGAEVRAQGEELFACQRLDRRGVEAPPSLAEAAEMEAEGDQRLARSGGGVEHHVAVGHQLEQGLLLRGVELEAGVRRPPEKEVEDLIGVVDATGRDP